MGLVTLFLCGDVMLGRGVDQILPHPGDPRLQEPCLADARGYVALAEERNGPIPYPVDFSWPWGDALETLDAIAPDARIINLETAVTRSSAFAPGKIVHYRMSPGNVPALTVARPDVCVLANNHVLDFGTPGLEETLDVLSAAGLRTAGAGREAYEAQRPAYVTAGDGRIVVLSFAMPCSGVPAGWAATAVRPGVAFVRGPSGDDIAARVRQIKRPGDLVVASVHWGSNWGYGVYADQVRFARRLVESGADIVHGHSSHHPRPVEVYRNRLILYGCGDLVNDYEGILGHEEYRDHLRLLYFATVDAGTGELAGLRIAAMRAERMGLRTAGGEDTAWVRATLERISRTPVELRPGGMLAVQPQVGAFRGIE